MFHLVALAALLATTTALADPLPAEKRRQYEPYSRGTSFTLGTMWLSSTYARFSRLKGRMTLEYAGKMESSDFELRDASIYRVTNAEAYFNLNKGKNGFCGAPVRWIGVRDLGRNEVRVTMLSIEDYRLYRADVPGLCSGDTYGLE